MSLMIKTLKGDRAPVWDKPVLGFNCVFVQIFCNTLDYLRIHLAKTCDESKVCVGTFCSASGYILPSPTLSTT